MPHVLLTGGVGFFGGILKRHLLRQHYEVTSIDHVPDPSWHPRLTKITGDLRDPWLMNEVLERARFDAVFHCAAMLAHGMSIDEQDLWASNVGATRMLAEACRDYGVPRLIFTSTNCLWASNPGHPISESEPPAPAEIYGRSKLAAEEILARYSRYMDVVVLRCPTIIDRGRLGLLAILFESQRRRQRGLGQAQPRHTEQRAAERCLPHHRLRRGAWLSRNPSLLRARLPARRLLGGTLPGGA